MTEELTKEIKLKRIQIKTESGSKWFKKGPDFISWVQQQQAVYAFLRQLPNQHNEHGFFNLLNQQWGEILRVAQVDLPPLCEQPEQYAEKVDLIVERFQQKLATKQIITGESPCMNFVAELENKQKAASALAYFLDFNLTGWDLTLAKGVQLAIDWERGLADRAEHEKDALNTLRDGWDENFNAQSERAELSQSRLEGLTDRADKQIAAEKERFHKQVASFEELQNKAVESTKQELENITRTYDENLALHASVRYWGLQEKYHKRLSFWFGGATIVVALLVVAGLYFFAEAYLAASIDAIHVSKLVTSLIITTFGIWAVRTCANLFMAHTHLRTDAQERRTMIHTYLALLRKGQGPKEDERQLILQTLFRPSATGMIKEDAGPSNVVDLLNRLKPGKT